MLSDECFLAKAISCRWLSPRVAPATSPTSSSSSSPPPSSRREKAKSSATNFCRRPASPRPSSGRPQFQ